MANQTNVAFYVEFDGVAAKLATRSSWPGSSGTIYAAIARPPSGSGEKLDRSRGIVPPATFTVEVHANSDIETFFARRGGTEYTLGTRIDEDDTTIQMGSGDTGLAGTTLYCERETITFGTHGGSGSYTGCTRGVSSSPEQAHPAGAIFSTRPRHWLNRRGTLYVVDLLDGTATALVSGFLRSSPKFVNGIYRLEFTGMQRELNRQLMVGWQSTTATFKSRDNGAQTVTFDGRNFSDNDDSYARFDFPGGAWMVKVESANVNIASGTLEVSIDPQYTYGEAGLDLSDFDANNTQARREGVIPDATVKTVFYADGDPVEVALSAMLSTYGRGVNSARYDTLPGLHAKDNGAGRDDITGRRVGAALPAAWVDVAGWEAARYRPQRARFWFDESIGLIDFLANEIAWRVGGYIAANGSGQLTLIEYEPALPSSAIVTYTKADFLVATKTVVDDESEIIGAAQMRCNYDPVNRKFRHTVTVRWVTTWQTYGEGLPQIELESRSLSVVPSGGDGSISSTFTEDDVVNTLDRIYRRTRDGLRMVVIVMPFEDAATFTIGYRFKLTDDDLPDGEGGTGFTARQYEVTGRDFNYETGTLTVQAEEQVQGYLFAPAAYVSGYDVGTKTVTFDTSATHEKDLFSGSTPAHNFPDGANVRIYDASGGAHAFAVNEVQTITSVPSSTTIVLDADASFGIANGDLVVLDWSADTGNQATNTAADVQDHAFADDNAGTVGNTVGGDTRTAYKWE